MRWVVIAVAALLVGLLAYGVAQQDAKTTATAALQAGLAPTGATVLGINTRDNTEDALGFVDRYDLSFPSLRDGAGDVAEEWGVAQYPESYLLDRDGKVAAVVQGPVTQAF